MKKGSKRWYTLLGWKGQSDVELGKVMKVLSFKGAIPAVGRSLFGEGQVERQGEVFAYSFQSSMSLKWNRASTIIFDHLSPMKPEFTGQPASSGPGPRATTRMSRRTTIRSTNVMWTCGRT